MYVCTCCLLGTLCDLRAFVDGSTGGNRDAEMDSVGRH